jgi:hypothetical protein
VQATMSEANRDDATNCLARAKQARAAGEFAKAKRLAEKSKSLFPTAEVCCRNLVSSTYLPCSGQRYKLHALLDGVKECPR